VEARHRPARRRRRGGRGKAYGGEAALRVARRAHQIMGAIGYSEEHPLHLFHKRILAASLHAGDPPQPLDAVARSIGLA